MQNGHDHTKFFVMNGTVRICCTCKLARPDTLLSLRGEHAYCVTCVPASVPMMRPIPAVPVHMHMSKRGNA